MRAFSTISVYFNSQPHKEADGKGIASGQQSSISTHSLTRRLTIRTTQVYVYVDISTHSLTRRLTFDEVKDLLDDGISTHSLTRRLTRPRLYHGFR